MVRGCRPGRRGRVSDTDTASLTRVDGARVVTATRCAHVDSILLLGGERHLARMADRVAQTGLQIPSWA